MLLKTFSILALLGFNNANADFPEMPFCPLGGPSGWLNRITNNHDYRPDYYMPPYQYNSGTPPNRFLTNPYSYNNNQTTNYQWRPYYQ